MQATKIREDWTPVEDAILTEFYPTHSFEDLQPRLPGRTHRSMVRRASLLGVKKARAWTPEQDAELADLYKTMGRRELSKFLGRTYSSVDSRLHTLGLLANRPPLHMQARKEQPWKEGGNTQPRDDFRAANRKACGLERRAGALKHKPEAPKARKWYDYPRGSAEYKAGEAEYFRNKQARTITDQYGRPATVYSNSSNAIGPR